VGGVLIRWQGASIMTAPLYSNPTIGELALSEIHVDRQRINGLMRQDVSDVAAILSGHSHYDHLMEVPFVALHKATKADIVGNDAMVKLLHPIEEDLEGRAPPNHLVSLERRSDYDVPGAPIRVRAVISEHSPQIGPRLISHTARLIGWLFPLPEVTFWRRRTRPRPAAGPSRRLDGGNPTGLRHRAAGPGDEGGRLPHLLPGHDDPGALRVSRLARQSEPLRSRDPHRGRSQRATMFKRGAGAWEIERGEEGWTKAKR
jgi:hypothetical protein